MLKLYNHDERLIDVVIVLCKQVLNMLYFDLLSQGKYI